MYINKNVATPPNHRRKDTSIQLKQNIWNTLYKIFDNSKNPSPSHQLLAYLENGKC